MSRSGNPFAKGYVPRSRSRRTARNRPRKDEKNIPRGREGKVIAVFLAIKRSLPDDIAARLDRKMLYEIILELTGVAPKDLASIDELEEGPWVEDELGTSKKAALAAYPNADTQRHAVLLEVALAGDAGATRDDIVIALRGQTSKKVSESAVDARVWELGPRGGAWIEPNGRVRKTPMGQDAEVLVLTEKGRSEVQKDPAYRRCVIRSHHG